MKQKKLVVLLFLIACMVTTMIPASARASYQIDDYFMDSFSNDEKIYVDFSVTGTNSMKLIGCESIYIYESNGGSWIEVDFLDENDPGMSGRNTLRYAETVNVDCEVGVRYKVVVTIFAEDSAGRDSRQQTFYVTGAA